MPYGRPLLLSPDQRQHRTKHPPTCLTCASSVVFPKKASGWPSFSHCERRDMNIMRRREFITLAGGLAVASPLGVRAQSAERVRRIGVLWRGDVNEGYVQVLQGVLLENLAKLGWIEGRSV